MYTSFFSAFGQSGTLHVLFPICRLIQMAPQYYDMSNFPECDAKRKLMALIGKVGSVQYQKGY